MKNKYFNFGMGVEGMLDDRIEALNMRNVKNGEACSRNGKSTSKVVPVIVTIMLWLFAFYAIPSTFAQLSGGIGIKNDPSLITKTTEPSIVWKKNSGGSSDDYFNSVIGVPLTLTGTVLPTATILPYYHDFEDMQENAQWILLNGTQINRWHIGNLDSNNYENSLFISNNNGATNTFSNNISSYVYAYRIFDFTETGLHTISFNWRCAGSLSLDNLRAFLVPDNISLEAGNAYGNTYFTNNVPENWIAVSGLLNEKNTWQNFINSNVYIPYTGLYKLVFFWKNYWAGSGLQPPAAIDNIFVMNKSVIVDNQNESLFAGLPGTVNFAVSTDKIADGSYTATVTNLPAGVTVSGQITIDNNSGVLTLAGGANTSAGIYANLILTLDGTISEEFTLIIKDIPFNLPYIHNFEFEQENAQWTLLNGTQTNKWHIGNAVSNSGENSLYISDNNGITNTYANTPYPFAISYVLAYRTFNFAETGIYTISFDWRCNGGYFDNVRAYLVPDNILLEAGNVYGNTYNHNVPANWIAVSDVLSEQNDWQNFLKNVVITNAGIYKLVFFWINGDDIDTQPPAAIDNIFVTDKAVIVDTQNEILYGGVTGTVTFPITTYKFPNGSYTATVTNLPEDVSINGQVTINDNSGVLMLDGGANTVVGVYSNLKLTIDGIISEEFKLVISSVPTYLPYMYGFEDEQENSLWILLNGTQTNRWHIGNAVSNSGENSLYISDNYGVTNTYSFDPPLLYNSFVYAYRTLTFTQPGLHTISFNWRCAGEDSRSNFRAFLVPDNILLEAGNAYGNTSVTNNIPANWIAISEILHGQSIWQNFKNANVSVPSAGVYKLVFFWKNNTNVGSQPPAAIDNIIVTSKNLIVNNQSESIFAGSANTVNFPVITRNIANGNYTAIVTNLPEGISVLGQVTIDNNSGVLTLAVGENVAAGIYSNLMLTLDGITSDEFTIVIIGAPINIPYLYDFEDEQENAQWTLLNENQPNRWHIGSAVSDEGAYSLYITNNNGVTNNYSIITNSTSYVYAFRVLNFSETGLHTISFNWRCAGEGNNDNFRAFLVPNNISLEAGNAYGNTGGTNNVPANWIAVSGVLSGQSAWQNFKRTDIFITNTGLYKLVFFWKNNNNSTGTQPPAAIDNIVVTNKTVNVATQNESIFGGSAGSVSFPVSTTNIANGSYTATVTNLPANVSVSGEVTLNNNSGILTLEVSTSVFVGIYSNLLLTIDGITSDEFTLIVSSISANVPYTHSFENEQENMNWNLLNGTQINGWYINNAVSNIGENSLYISNNNGNTNTYSISSTSYVYAFRVINFTETGLHTVSFKWRCAGEENFDNVRVFLVPNNITLVAGNAYGSTGATNYVPANWIAVSGILRGQSTWQNFTNSNVNVPNTGLYKLVFFWKNNNSIGTQPPAAIDNIVVTAQHVVVDTQNESIFAGSAGMVTFAVTTRDIANGSYNAIITNLPADVSVLGQVIIHNNSGVLTLEGGTNTVAGTYTNLTLTIDDITSEDFTLVVSAFPVYLPYTQDFEDVQENLQWTLLNGNQPNKWHIGSSVSFSGANSLYISNVNNNNNYDNVTSYVYAYRVLNITETGLHTISFNWRCAGEYNNDNVRVFLVPDNLSLEAGNAYGNTGTTNDVPANWIAVSGILEGQDTWQKFINSNVYVPNTGLYKLVFFWKNNNNSILTQPPAAIDNIVVTARNVFVDAQNEYFFAGLSGSVTYTVTTRRIANGSYTATVTNLPADVSVLGHVTIENNSSVLTLAGGANTVAGIYSDLKLTIEGITSEEFTLIITVFPANLPYIYDFEDEQENDQWTLLNGTQTNKWYIGNAVSNGGENSLYISNNNGIENTYSLSPFSYVYAYRGLNFTQSGLYTISFNWRCEGEGNFDNVRAFLIPDNISLEAGNTYGNTGNSNYVPTNWIAVSGVLYGQCIWQNFKNSNVYVPNTGLYNFVFFWKNDNSSGTQPPAAIDNVIVTAKNVFVDVQNERIFAGSSGIVTFPVTTRDFANGSYAAIVTNLPTGVMVSGQVTINNNSGVLILECDTNTIEGIYSNLSLTIDGINSDVFTFVVSIAPANLPYTNDFEDEQENSRWNLLNGTERNKWYIGNAVSNSGENSLYISNNNGNENTYSTLINSYVYAYRGFYFNQSDLYTISFNWRCEGEGNYDNVRVFLVPDNISLEAGNAYGNESSTNNVPANWIAVSGILMGQSTWQNFINSNFNVPNTGLYKLVFFWKNDSLVGIQPPAAIDNIEIYKTFIPVTNITNVPLTAFIDVPLTLEGIVEPDNAINKTIVWSVENAGTTEAFIEENLLFGSANGIATIRATIENGLAIGTNYWKNFNITITKRQQSPPEAPTLLEKTQTSITLNEISGCEYRINGSAWQSSTTFSGLTPNTEYSFEARKMEAATHFASDASHEALFTTNKAILSGTLTINGSAVYGELLTANTSDLSSTPEISDLGDLTFQWKLGEVTIGSNSDTYTIVEADINSVITVTVTSFNCEGSITSPQIGPVTKAEQDAPEAPALLEKTQTSITLNEIAGCEYRIDEGEWQTETTFSGLNPNTEYSFEVRKMETNTHFASNPSSPPTIIITEPLNNYIITATVNDPTLGTITPEGDTTVEEGGSLTYTITPFGSNEIIDVLVNWASYGVITTYTFENVQSDGRIEAIFGTVSIDKSDFGNINIYTHKNSIHIKNDSEKPLKSVEIYDMTGRLVFQDGIKEIETVITLNVATGIYVVKVIWEDGKMEAIKLRIEN